MFDLVRVDLVRIDSIRVGMWYELTGNLHTTVSERYRLYQRDILNFRNLTAKFLKLDSSEFLEWSR